MGLSKTGLNALLLMTLLCVVVLVQGSTPSCAIQLSREYELHDWDTQARLEQRWSVWHVVIGASHVLTQNMAASLSSFSDYPFVGVPSSWYYDVSTHTQNSTRAYAACGERQLNNVSLEEGSVRAYMSFRSLDELVGGPFTFSTSTNIVMPARALTSTTSMPEFGYASRTGCALLQCAFEGTFDDQDAARVRFYVTFSLERVGIGIPEELYAYIFSERPSKCVTLLVHPGLRIPLCIEKIACRSDGQLCVNSVYAHSGGFDAGIIVGFDALLADNMQLVFHVDPARNTSTVGIAWIGSSFWSSDPVRVCMYIIVGIIALNWRPIPMATMVESTTTGHELQIANVISSLFMVVASFYFMLNGAYDAMSRTIDDRHDAAVLITSMLLASIVAHACFIIYAHATMQTKSDLRASHVRLFYTALICEAIVMLSCGATEYDIQALYCVAASATWFFCVARSLSTLDDQLGSVAIISFFASIPAMVVAVEPSVELAGIEQPWSYCALVCTICALCGVASGLEPYYRDITGLMNQEE